MKSKEITGKLVLSKKTVANLAESDLDSVRGGYTYSCLQETCDYACGFTKNAYCTVLTCYVC
jgi:hypothetical protein